MDPGPLGGAESRASLGRPSMGAPGRWLALEAWTLGARLAERVDAGLRDQSDDDGNEHEADESAAVPERRVRPEHAARGIACAQGDTQTPLNLAVNAEEQQRARIGGHIDGAGAGGGVQEIESIHPNEQQHQETAGAGAEEAVIETDAADGRQGKVGARP